jgi:hypothetical protein
VVAIVLGGVALANRSDDATTATTPTTTSAAPSPSPTATTPRPSPSTTSAAPTPSAALLDAGDYLGRPVEDVDRELVGLGYTVVREPRPNPAEDEGTVVDLQPTGRLAPGETVTVTYATAPPAPTPSAEPTPSASPSPTGEGEPDEDEADEDENGAGNGKGKDDKPGKDRGGNG